MPHPDDGRGCRRGDYRRSGICRRAARGGGDEDLCSRGAGARFGEATAARSGTARDAFELGDDRLGELPEGLIWLTMMLGCLGVGFALHRGDTEAPVRMRFR